MRWKVLTAALIISFCTVGLSTPATADQTRQDQWYLQSLDVARAQRLAAGEGVTVAVVDSGVANHRDLDGALLPGFTLLSGKDGHPNNDPAGHGTAMAGLIAARGHSGTNGILGIAPEAKILPIKVEGADPERGASPDKVGEGIRKAVQAGANVINVSLATVDSEGLRTAVAFASEHDALVVAGIGNTTNDIYGGHPAVMPGVLAVGATDKSGELAPISIADKNVLLCAPGDFIPNLAANDTYKLTEGTSNSTAIVSGAVALLREKFPKLSSREVIHRLTATADDNGPPGRDTGCGYGLINIVKALTADVPPLPSPTPTAAPSSSTPTSAAAQPPTKPASNSTPLIVGAVLGLLLVGGVGAAVVVTRRRRGGQPYG